MFRVLGRDQAALVDLVHALLEPLTRSRGGAEPLLQTLETYFATGAVATETARRLHMSVRTVTYRLAKVKTLTGTDPTDPRPTLGTAHGGRRSPAPRLARLRPTPTAAGASWAVQPFRGPVWSAYVAFLVGPSNTEAANCSPGQRAGARAHSNCCGFHAYPGEKSRAERMGSFLDRPPRDGQE